MEFTSKSQKQSQNDKTQVQQIECEWEIVKKFTKPSPATWFEIALIYGILVKKPKTELRWRNPIPATWVCMRNCQEIYQTNPATWFEIALINGIHIEKPKTESKWRNPSPSTWVWMRNCQETYQTKSTNLIWNCFDIWNSGRKAKNRVEMTELKSRNLSVNEKLPKNLPNQVQQLDLKLL